MANCPEGAPLVKSLCSLRLNENLQQPVRKEEVNK